MSEFSEFKLNMELGNAAMSGAHDVALALEEAAAELRSGYTSGRTVDANGNSVGSWELT